MPVKKVTGVAGGISKKVPKKATPSVNTGAATIHATTHAFSLNGAHLAWAVLTGRKVVENRQFRMAPGWYALALTKQAFTGVADDAAYRGRFPFYPGFQAGAALKGNIVGAVKISHSLPHAACSDDFFASSDYKFKNVICEYLSFVDWTKPGVGRIPARGNLGAWPMAPETTTAFQSVLESVLQSGVVPTVTDASHTYPVPVPVPPPSSSSSSSVAE